MCNCKCASLLESGIMRNQSGFNSSCPKTWCLILAPTASTPCYAYRIYVWPTTSKMCQRNALALLPGMTAGTFAQDHTCLFRIMLA